MFLLFCFMCSFRKCKILFLTACILMTAVCLSADSHPSTSKSTQTHTHHTEHTWSVSGSADTLTWRCGAQHSSTPVLIKIAKCLNSKKLKASDVLGREGFSCSKYGESLEPAACPLPLSLRAQNSPPWERCNFSLSHDKDWADWEDRACSSEDQWQQSRQGQNSFLYLLLSVH